MNGEYLKVSELNRFIKDVLNAGFPQPVWVCGEIQQYDRNKSKKHIFFELVEKDPRSDEILARVGLVIFANRKAAIDQVLAQSENAFALKDDIEVKFRCTVDFYPPHGAVRLIVEEIDPTYTLGKLAQEKQKLIAALKEKGVLDKNKQLPLPLVPLAIGLITSDDSAAYNDFISELRKSGYGFKVYLRNTLMQGKNAPKDVCRALAELQRIDGLETIIITRGGGSLAELSCFDSALIAEAVAACPVPVLSGIGHEINITITDMAAHTYAKTPTAIAQYLVERVQGFLTGLDEQLERLLHETQTTLTDYKQRLKDLAAGLQRGTMFFFKDHREQLIRWGEILKHKPAVLLSGRKNALAVGGERLKRGARTLIVQKRDQLKAYKRIIEIAHPANTMKRGFSVTRTRDGRILRSISQARVDQEITTEVADGKVRSKVLKP
ncbi:MAG: exodeoxyribonuclease VII large subunit [Candidatus Omnitrophica bacterium]|nr:exodeoxyribonuclease VII large subunit [Candidatus Omnitrophota bacterium]